MSRLPPDNDAYRSTGSSTASDNPPPALVILLAPCVAAPRWGTGKFSWSDRVGR